MNDLKQQKNSIFQKAMFLHQGSEMSPENQLNLNSPTKKTAGLDKELKAYLKKILKLIETNQVNLSKASSLINNNIYSQLSFEHQRKVEITSHVIINNLRLIKNLHDSPTYETESKTMENLINSTIETIKGLESIEGNVLII